MSNQVDIVKSPYYHLTEVKGKEIRSCLIDAFNYWFKVSDEDLETIKLIVDKLHNASLLIDDIEDNSKLRRGKPCAHLIYGVPATINSANYIYFEALQDCTKLSNSPKIIQVFMRELLLLHRGQAMDIHWRDNVICPSEQEYIEMVKNKTGGLFRLCVSFLHTCSNEHFQNCDKLVNNMAILFQILDDYLNLKSSHYHENKSFCEDLTEGKFSFPIIHSISQTTTTSSQLLNILRQKTTDEDLKKYALHLMEQSNSFQYTRQILSKYERMVTEEISALGGNSLLTSILSSLMSKLQQQEDS